MRFLFYVKVIFQVIWELIDEGILNRLPKPIRGKLCWLLRHKYPVIFFKSKIRDVNSGITDTEAGCVFCGFTKQNIYPINVNNIDWTLTKHRTAPPLHNVSYFHI